jgi:hypothetical protein
LAELDCEVRDIVHEPPCAEPVSVHWPDPELPEIVPLNAMPPPWPAMLRAPNTVTIPEPEPPVPSTELVQLPETVAWVAFPGAMVNVQVPESAPV